MDDRVPSIINFEPVLITQSIRAGVHRPKVTGSSVCAVQFACIIQNYLERRATENLAQASGESHVFSRHCSLPTCTFLNVSVEALLQCVHVRLMLRFGCFTGAQPRCERTHIVAHIV